MWIKKSVFLWHSNPSKRPKDRTVMVVGGDLSRQRHKIFKRKGMIQLVSMDGKKKHHHENRCTMHTSVFLQTSLFHPAEKDLFPVLVWELGGSIFQLPWSCFPHCFAPFLWPFLICFGDGNVWKPETHIKMWALIRLQASHQKAMCWVFLQPFSYSSLGSLQTFWNT